MRRIPACARPRPAGIGTASSALTRRRCAQFSRCMLMTRSPGVTWVTPGDLVINMQRENWAQRRRVKADDAVPIPAGLGLAQAGILRINPPTALLLLGGHVRVAPGGWGIGR